MRVLLYLIVVLSSVSRHFWFPTSFVWQRHLKDKFTIWWKLVEAVSSSHCFHFCCTYKSWCQKGYAALYLSPRPNWFSGVILLITEQLQANKHCSSENCSCGYLSNDRHHQCFSQISILCHYLVRKRSTADRHGEIEVSEEWNIERGKRQYERERYRANIKSW